MSSIIHHAPGLTAAILVGGKSRRMGKDKALLRLRPDGPTVIEIVAQSLEAVADEVLLVGAPDVAYAFLGLPEAPDLIPNAGALGGIHAALSTMTHSHVLVVGCDMPFLSVDLLRFMRDQPCDYDVLVPFLDQQHPLHAIYAADCLPLIEQSLHAGNNRVMSWWRNARVRELHADAMLPHDPTLRSCFNMNTPEDLATAMRLV